MGYMMSKATLMYLDKNNDVYENRCQLTGFPRNVYTCRCARRSWSRDPFPVNVKSLKNTYKYKLHSAVIGSVIKSRYIINTYINKLI